MDTGDDIFEELSDNELRNITNLINAGHYYGNFATDEGCEIEFSIAISKKRNKE